MFSLFSLFKRERESLVELVSLFEEFEGSDFFSVVGSRSKKHSKGASARRPDCTERLPCARVGNRRRLDRRACEAALDDLDGRGDGEKVRRAKKSEQKKNKIKIHFPPFIFSSRLPPPCRNHGPGRQAGGPAERCIQIARGAPGALCGRESLVFERFEVF